MRRWIEQNLLATYGAVVGTVAILLNLVRFRYDRRKDNIQLRVSSKLSSDFAANVAMMSSTQIDEMSASQIAAAYVVTVFNDGLVAAPLAALGIRDVDGKDVPGLTRRPGSNTLTYYPVDQAGIEPLGPKSSQSVTVYFHRGQPVPIANSCFVVDQTGKRWNGRHRSA